MFGASRAFWLAGEEVGDIFAGGRAYDVQLWSIPAARDSLTDVQAVPIDTPAGETIRLDQIADVRVAPTPNTIERENLSRRLEVSANVEGRDLGSVAEDLDDAVEDITFPIGYHAELLGEWKEREDAQRSMLLFGVGAAAMIFLLLQASFGSWRLATLSFLTLPMALVGGALAAYLGGGILSLGSLVGFFTVFGIAARNGILMINHFQHLEQHEGETFGPKLVLRGARERLAPILMTTLATGLAIVPARRRGQHPGQRDRASARRRRPRRTRHLDAAQSLRGAGALPAVRAAGDSDRRRRQCVTTAFHPTFISRYQDLRQL